MGKFTGNNVENKITSHDRNELLKLQVARVQVFESLKRKFELDLSCQVANYPVLLNERSIIYTYLLSSIG